MNGLAQDRLCAATQSKENGASAYASTSRSSERHAVHPSTGRCAERRPFTLRQAQGERGTQSKHQGERKTQSKHQHERFEEPSCIRRKFYANSFTANANVLPHCRVGGAGLRST